MRRACTPWPRCFPGALRNRSSRICLALPCRKSPRPCRMYRAARSSPPMTRVIPSMRTPVLRRASWSSRVATRRGSRPSLKKADTPMPSFDVVSELDAHEVANAVDQANRELSQRFDFKDSGARYELLDFVVTLHAQVEFQLKQMLDILKLRLSKRGVDIACLEVKEPQASLSAAHQEVILRHGIDQETGKKITRLIKDSKLKVQASLQS